MHSTYLSNFEVPSKQQVDQILKKLKNLMTAHNYTNCTLKNGKFSFLKQIPTFFYQNIFLIFKKFASILCQTNMGVNFGNTFPLLTDQIPN
jgi:hypothetical protein